MTVRSISKRGAWVATLALVVYACSSSDDRIVSRPAGEAGEAGEAGASAVMAAGAGGAADQRNPDAAGSPSGGAHEAGAPTSLAGAGGASGGANVCDPSASALELTIEGPDGYACHERYQVKLTVSNHGCEPVDVGQILLESNVTSGPCAPASPYTTAADVALVAPGESTVVLDLLGAPFCCGAPGCTTALVCDERIDFTVATSAGDLQGSADVAVNLALGCNEVCP